MARFSRISAHPVGGPSIEWYMKIGESTAAHSGTFLIGGDMPVNRLGYGTMRLLGITLIDTADAYGPEIAERLIGEALYPYLTGLVIATKGGITRQGPAKTEYVGRAGYLVQCVEMSLRRLKLERIDLYQLHRIDPRTPLEESLGALKRMQEQGKIRHIGLSEVTPTEIEEARKIVEVVTVQNRYSLTDRRHQLTLDYCELHGIGFMPWYPIAGGKMLRPDQPSAEALARVATRRSCSVAQLSVAWLLQRSPVMLPIPGTSKVPHLEENVAASGLTLNRSEWDEVEAAVQG